MTIWKMNGKPLEHIPDFGNDRPEGIMGYLDAMSDAVLNWEFGEVVKPAGGWFEGQIQHLIHLLNANSVEIIIAGIMICGLGMMIGPMIGQGSGKWFGRAFFIFWAGAVWRVLIP